MNTYMGVNASIAAAEWQSAVFSMLIVRIKRLLVIAFITGRRRVKDAVRMRSPKPVPLNSVIFK